MSVSRRASFAAGIAAVRRDRRRGAASGSAQEPAGDSHHPVEPAAESTITVVAGLPTSPASPTKKDIQREFIATLNKQSNYYYVHLQLTCLAERAVEKGVQKAAAEVA